MMSLMTGNSRLVLGWQKVRSIKVENVKQLSPNNQHSASLPQLHSQDP